MTVGDIDIELVHTPGHTPGSQCFSVAGRLVAGDTLFLDGCGRTDLPGGDAEQMYESLTTRLARFGDDTVLYPGHLYSPEPSATMGETRATQLRLPAPHRGAVDDDVRVLTLGYCTRVPPSPSSARPWPACAPPRRCAPRAFRGRIVLIGAEPHLPYDRPPLSKQFLAGTWGLDRVRLRDEDKIDALGLDLRLGCDGHRPRRRRSPRRTRRDGERARLRRPRHRHRAPAPARCPAPPGWRASTCLRTLDDSIALASATAAEGTRLVVVGAGFIGSEVAATCHGRGVDVTVVEALAVPLAGVLGEEMGAACGALHARHGVDVRTGSRWWTCSPRYRTSPPARSVTGSGAKVVGIDSPTAPSSTPTSWWSASVWSPPPTGWTDSGSRHRQRCAWPTPPCTPPMTSWWPVTWPAGSTQRQQEHIRIEHWTNAAEQGVAGAAQPAGGTGRCRALRPGAVLLVRPVRHQDPDDRIPAPRRRGRRGRRVAVRRAASSPSTAEAAGSPPRSGSAGPAS